MRKKMAEEPPRRVLRHVAEEDDGDSTKWIHLLGAITAFGYLISTVASYWLAPSELALEGNEAAVRFYVGLTHIGPVAIFDHYRWLLTAYTAPLLLSTAGAAVAMLFVKHLKPSSKTVFVASRWAIVFAVIAVFALPVIAQDFWLSAGWGQMAAHGINPYYKDMPSEIASAWVPDQDIPRMTYGPLWATASAILMALTRSQVVAFVLFKALLLGFWLGALWLVRRLTSALSPEQQTMAIIATGWLPASVSLSLAEGHNDVAMVAFILLWLWSKSPFAIVAAVGCKYVAAPLALLDLVRERRLSQWVGAGLFGLLILLFFYRDRSFFLATTSMQSWPAFLTPAAALGVLGLFGKILVWIVTAAGVSLTLWRWLTLPSEQSWRKAVIAVVAGVAFGVVGHLWPWFVLWVLLPAALVPAWWFSRLVFGVALLAPFSILYLTANHPFAWLHGLPSVLFYLGAVAWLILSVTMDKIQIETKSEVFQDAGD
jgi:hypothetical protein